MNMILNSYKYIVFTIDVSFIVVADESRAHRVDRDVSSMENQRGGRFDSSSRVLSGSGNMGLATNTYNFTVRTRSLVANWEKKDISPGHEGYASSNPLGAVSSVNTLPVKVVRLIWNFALIFRFLFLCG